MLRHEQLEEDYAACALALGLRPTPLPRVNLSAGTARDREAAATDRAVRRAVRERFADHYARFGYA